MGSWGPDSGSDFTPRGLTISALVRTTTQAVMWVPLLLIPQILFGGFVVSIPEMSKPVRAVAK